MNTWSVLYDLCMGFGVTLKLFALTLVISIPLGLLFAVLSMVKFKPVAYLMKVIIWIVRGTPLLLQCVVVTFIPSVLLRIPNKDFAAALGIDTMTDLQFFFVLIAFAGVVSTRELLLMMAFQYGSKLVIEATMGTPMAYAAVHALRRWGGAKK